MTSLELRSVPPGFIVTTHDGETASFANLWNSINGPGAWDANPWVVAIGFCVVRGNIDSLPPAPEVGR